MEEIKLILDATGFHAEGQKARTKDLGQILTEYSKSAGKVGVGHTKTGHPLYKGDYIITCKDAGSSRLIIPGFTLSDFDVEQKDGDIKLTRKYKAIEGQGEPFSLTLKGFTKVAFSEWGVPEHPGVELINDGKWVRSKDKTPVPEAKVENKEIVIEVTTTEPAQPVKESKGGSGKVVVKDKPKKGPGDKFTMDGPLKAPPVIKVPDEDWKNIMSQLERNNVTQPGAGRKISRLFDELKDIDADFERKVSSKERYVVDGKDISKKEFEELRKSGKVKSVSFIIDGVKMTEEEYIKATSGKKGRVEEKKYSEPKMPEASSATPKDMASGYAIKPKIADVTVEPQKKGEDKLKTYFVTDEPLEKDGKKGTMRIFVHNTDGAFSGINIAYTNADGSEGSVKMPDDFIGKLRNIYTEYGKKFNIVGEVSCSKIIVINGSLGTNDISYDEIPIRSARDVEMLISSLGTMDEGKSNDSRAVVVVPKITPTYIKEYYVNGEKVSDLEYEELKKSGKLTVEKQVFNGQVVDEKTAAQLDKIASGGSGNEMTLEEFEKYQKGINDILYPAGMFKGLGEGVKIAEDSVPSALPGGKVKSGVSTGIK